MKKFMLLIATASLLLSCVETRRPVDEYFRKTSDSVQTGGVRLIPVATPKGTFKVWTKQFGNNPRIRLLLLHGGPGQLMSTLSALKISFPLQGSNSSITTSSAPPIPTSRKRKTCGLLIGLSRK